MPRLGGSRGNAGHRASDRRERNGGRCRVSSIAATALDALRDGALAAVRDAGALPGVGTAPGAVIEVPSGLDIPLAARTLCGIGYVRRGLLPHVHHRRAKRRTYTGLLRGCSRPQAVGALDHQLPDPAELRMLFNLRDLREYLVACTIIARNALVVQVNGSKPQRAGLLLFTFYVEDYLCPGDAEIVRQ